MEDKDRFVLALFYCRNIPESNDKIRQGLEKQYGESVRFFPLPCSGRIESLHLLKALEDYADAAYLITCPEGLCRYFEGNVRAKKRVQMARSIIESIGLEGERIGIEVRSDKDKKGLTELAREIFEKVNKMGPSPVHNRK
jgi:F420-non-reducing hydrogenase iron-sulfur subunit